MGERTDTETRARETISLGCQDPEAGVLLAGELLAAGDIKRELRPNLCPRVLDGLITLHRPPYVEHGGDRFCAALHGAARLGSLPETPQTAS